MDSITKHRYFFRTTFQRPRESTVDWALRLNQQAKFCNFYNVDDQIFDQIVEKTKLIELRNRACQEEISLSDLLDLANNIERHLCKRCGSMDDYHNYGNCPAKTYICMNCNKRGHFTECCENHFKRSLPMELLPKKDNKRARYEGFEENQLGDLIPFIKVEPGLEKNNVEPPKKDPRIKDQPSTSKNVEKNSKNSFSCKIGDAASRFIVSDKYMVNVMSKKFFDGNKIKCCIHSNKETVINGVKFSAALETKVERNGKHINVEFFFSDEVDEEICVITNHNSKKLM